MPTPPTPPPLARDPAHPSCRAAMSGSHAPQHDLVTTGSTEDQTMGGSNKDSGRLNDRVEVFETTSLWLAAYLFCHGVEFDGLRVHRTELRPAVTFEFQDRPNKMFGFVMEFQHGSEDCLPSASTFVRTYEWLRSIARDEELRQRREILRVLEQHP